MAVSSNEYDISLPVAADYSAAQYKVVDLNSSGQAVIVSAAGQACIGVLQDDPTAAGQAGRVRIRGSSKVIAGGAITKGTWLTTDSSARVVTKTANDACTVGVAVSSCSNAGEYVEVLLMPGADNAAYHGKVLSIPVTLANVADGDVVTNYTPGFAGTIEKFSFLVTSAVTTGSKGTTLNLEIGSTNLTGGVLTLTSAAATPLGKVIDATAITAANVFSATDTISVEASSTTAFSEGAGVLLIVLK